VLHNGHLLFHFSQAANRFSPAWAGGAREARLPRGPAAAAASVATGLQWTPDSFYFFFSIPYMYKN